MLTHFFCFPLTGVRGDFLVICTQTLNTESDIINVKSGEQNKKTKLCKTEESVFFLASRRKEGASFQKHKKRNI